MIHSLPLVLFACAFLISRVDSFVFTAGKATEFKRDKFSKHHNDEDKRLFAQTVSKSILQPAEVLAASAAASPVVTNTASVIIAKVQFYYFYLK